jgi:hypothetical protein
MKRLDEHKLRVRSIIDAVGVDTIMSGLQVNDASVRKARSDGRFSASWYRFIRDHARNAGVDVDSDDQFESLFSFKGGFDAN